MAGKPGGPARGGVPRFWAPKTALDISPTRTNDCLLLFEDASGGNLILQDNTGFLALELCGDPLTRFEWVNPRAPQRSIDLYGFIQAVTALTLPVSPPTAQFDWPNPRAAQRAIDLYGFSQALSLTLNPPLNPLIAQFDWPNPRGPQQAIDLYGWTQPLTVLNFPVPTPPPSEEAPNLPFFASMGQLRSW